MIFVSVNRQGELANVILEPDFLHTQYLILFHMHGGASGKLTSGWSELLRAGFRKEYH